jgi:hypothetical protein
MLNRKERSACSNEAGENASGSIATGRAIQAGQVSVEESKREYGRVLRGAHSKTKAWPSRFGIGHKYDKLILEKLLTLRRPKKFVTIFTSLYFNCYWRTSLGVAWECCENG